MSSRFRIALALVLLAAMIVSVSVSAKGGFAFISITGPNMKETVRAADGELTQDFFAFADFSRNKRDAPADPGVGYEVTRYYIDNNREVAFDKLHYYPDAGFVFYDGIVNGSSEYDGKWYTARPEIKAAFENALPGAASTVSSSSKPVEQTQPSQSTQQHQPIDLTRFSMPFVITAGVAAVLILLLTRRKRAVQ